MAYSAPHLGELMYDWDIPGDEVALLQPDSETEYIPKGLAIDIAQAQGRRLVPEFQSDAEPVFCNIATLALPPRWERGPDRDPDAELDEELWFIGFCGKRDLLTGNPHTFHGDTTNGRVGATASDQRLRRQPTAGSRCAARRSMIARCGPPTPTCCSPAC